MSKNPVLEISIGHVGWRRIPRLKARLEAAACATLEHLPKRLQFPCTVSLLLANDAAMRKLNRDFRGIDKPTNVLSFPQFEPSELPKKGKTKQIASMGDIIMGYQYVGAEAKKDNKILINHVIHLLIHGILHLFGYDHGLPAEAARMEGLEKKIMAELKLPDPYTSRTPAPRKK
jgi:probable rRNA maturation factor